MICENCKKNNATTHIHTVVNGIVTDKNLCSHCAAKLGFSGFSHNPLANMLASIFGDTQSNLVDSKRCQCCGSSFSDIARTGKVGCAECYQTYKEELLPYIKRLHGGTSHIGKSPNTSKTNSLVSFEKKETSMQISRIDALKNDLKRCIENEEYERAAIIRDEIKKITKEGAPNE